MLPPNIQNLVSLLTDKSKNGEVHWNYDPYNETVNADLTHFTVSLKYDFNMIEEVGEFIFYYSDKNTGIQYDFSTNQLYNDYSRVKYLFDIAKSTGLNFNF